MLKNKISKILIIITAIILSAIYYKTFIKADITLISNVRGKILLQVEQNGEAWYVNPHTDERYFLGRPDDAFKIMRDLGVGITNQDIKKMPIAEANFIGADIDNDGLADVIEDAIGTNKEKADTDSDGHNDKIEILNNYNPNGSGKLPIDIDFASGQAGKILIQVEQNGEAWYINPDNNKRYFLGKPNDAFSIMRNLGLGITNENLTKIQEFTTDKKLQNDYIVENNTTIAQTNNSLRKYTDTNYYFYFNYPKDWQIQKPSDFDNVIFLGDYDESLFSEKKGLITMTYLKTDQDLSLDNFKIDSKPGAEKNIEEIITFNNNLTLKEGFKYSKSKSFEITATIQKNSREFLQITLVSAGSENYYVNIYNSIIDSIEFIQNPTIESSCQNHPGSDFCSGGIDDIIANGTDENGCIIWTCKEEESQSSCQTCQ